MLFQPYRIESIDPHTWLIKDQINSILYLLEGERFAALIDTGSGVCKLRPVVESLTSKPVIVINTHYHGDHTGANFEFDQMMISREDAAFLEHPNDVCISDAFIRSLFSAVFNRPMSGEEEAAIHEPRRTCFPPVTLLEPHQIIDLGGRTLEVLPIPGHTKGSIMLLEADCRRLYSGDSCCSTHGVLLHLEPHTCVEDFREGLSAIRARQEEFDCIYPGHHLYPLAPSYLDDFIACCRDIETGTAECTPSDRGEGVLQARHGDALIIFRPERVHRLAGE